MLYKMRAASSYIFTHLYKTTYKDTPTKNSFKNAQKMPTIHLFTTKSYRCPSLAPKNHHHKTHKEHPATSSHFPISFQVGILLIVSTTMVGDKK